MNSTPEEITRESLEAQRDSVRAMIESLAEKIRPTTERIEVLQRHVDAIEDTLASVFPVPRAIRSRTRSEEDSNGGMDFTALAKEWLGLFNDRTCTEKDFYTYLVAQGLEASRNSVRNVFRNLKNEGLVRVLRGDEGSGRRPTYYTVVARLVDSDTAGLSEADRKLL